MADTQVADDPATKTAPPGEAVPPTIITFMSMKGGAGKTISLMALASALVERGYRIAALEADEVTPISKWKNHALTKKTWNPNIFIHQARTTQDLGIAFQGIEKDKVDYVLVDTAGGGSELNQNLILNSKIVIVPTGLDPTEMDALFETCNYLVEVVEGTAVEIPIVILLNRTPTRESALSVTHRMGLTTLTEAQLPVLKSRLPRRQVLADTASTGVLKRYYELCRSRLDRRMMAPEVLKSVHDSEALTDEILAILKDAAEATE